MATNKTRIKEEKKNVRWEFKTQIETFSDKVRDMVTQRTLIFAAGQNKGRGYFLKQWSK